MDMGKACILVFIFLVLCSTSNSEDQLTQAKPLFSGDTLISTGGDFALGFFSPTNSNKSLYVGIWYHNLPEVTVVWVANRDNPVTTPSAQLAIINGSELVLSDAKGVTLWTTANNATAAAGAVAVLLSSGNFVLRASNGNVIWQSFNHPTNTILPTMKIWLGYRAQTTTRFFAWKGPDDPSTGGFSGGVDPDSNLQFFIWNGTVLYCRAAVRNDASLFQAMVNKGDEFYHAYTVTDGTPYMRLVLGYTGQMQLLSWSKSNMAWLLIQQIPSSISNCDLYGSCGLYGYCDNTAPVPSCHCLDGFELVNTGNFSRGCRRKEALKCGKKTHFVTLPGMKVPDKFSLITNTTFDKCAAECSGNCSCRAYAYAKSSNVHASTNMSMCLVWTGDLVDMGKVELGENLYLRIADSSVPKKRNLPKILLPITSCVLLVALVTIVWRCKYRGIQQKKKAQRRMMLEYLRTEDEARDKNIEFPFISFEDIIAATYNFSDSNMLGKGGFGKVYKGILGGTKEVAVKRLSKGSGQGTEEFRNEVVLISKLQHKNLIKLLGCCIHEDEKMLVYEYLPNKSLDYFLFDSARKPMLQWPARFKIIQGIARGIMYLHHESRLTIIHRDLKSSNILLDKEMSPKISDFGMARIFYNDQPEANTNRVVGTYGYMSHEYAMEGAFSVKSDTYSFGVLLLEIVSGLKISWPHLIKGFPNLIVYAWNLWKDGKTEDLVDSAVKNNCPLDGVSRCIHIGLLCVQDSPDYRPLMSAVVFMLENNTTPLPVPVQPVYFARRNAEPQRTSNNRVSSVNDMSLTMLDGR